MEEEEEEASFRAQRLRHGGFYAGEGGGGFWRSPSPLSFTTFSPAGAEAEVGFCFFRAIAADGCRLAFDLRFGFDFFSFVFLRGRTGRETAFSNVGGAMALPS